MFLIMAADMTTIIIVNYRSWQMLCRCIESLKVHLDRAVRIIVVDNSEEPEGDKIVAQYPDVELITAQVNLGFAAGCNLGIKRALEHDTDYILLLNPDTRAESDFLRVMLKVLAQHPQIGMVGPMIVYDTPGRELWNGGGDLNWFAGGTRNIIVAQRKGDEVYDVSFLSGCALLLRADAVRQVGFMAEEYFLYFEDTDYVQRFLRCGWQVVYTPASLVLHRPSTTTGFQSESYVYYFSRNRIWFMQHWATWYHYLIFMLYNTFVKLPGAIIIFGLKQRRISLVKAYFKGYRDGLCRFLFL